MERTAWSWIKKCSSALIGLLLSAPAWAGACCSGTTTTMPTRLGPCEHWVVGLGLGSERSAGRWDSTGQPVASSLMQQSALVTLGAGWRWDRHGQVVLALPGRANHYVAGELVEWGGGVGDVVAQVLWNPWEEPKAGAPLLSGGARLPTGQPWTGSDSALFADVTGLPGASVLLGAAWERTTGTWPWRLGLDAGVPVGESSPLLLEASGSVGHAFGTAWSMSAGLDYQQTWAEAETRRTSASLVGVYGVRLRWRAWAGARADLPVPGLGLDNPRLISGVAGVAIVR